MRLATRIHGRSRNGAPSGLAMGRPSCISFRLGCFLSAPSPFSKRAVAFLDLTGPWVATAGAAPTPFIAQGRPETTDSWMVSCFIRNSIPNEALNTLVYFSMDVVRGLSSGTIDALKSLFVALAFIAVILRLVANWLYTRRLLVDDYISICAIPFLIGVSVLSDMAGNGFHDPNVAPYKVAQLAVAISVLTPLALWSCKAPILFLYLRVFGLKRWLRIASSITLVLIGLVYISGIVAIPPACTPHTRNLSQQFIETCQERTRATNVYLGSVSVVADVVILVLPMPVIFGLKLLVPSRIGLLFLFISGLFAIAASIISLYFKAMSLKVPGTSLAISILATITECSVAVIVGCVPSLRVLWSKILKRSAPTTTTEIATDATEDRMNRSGSSPQDSDVEGRPNRKTLDPNAMLVVSTQVHTSRTILTDQHTASPSAYQGRPYYVQAYYRPGREQSDEESQPPFGVYAEAYALQTRHQGGWAR